MLPSILELTDDEVAGWCVERGYPRYRSRQIRRWIHERRARSFEEMTDLPRQLRDDLQSAFSFFQAEVLQHQTASDRTEKLLLQMPGGDTVECVLMRETARQTICISTQVGCAMGCVFCASGMLGLKRNLSRAEIFEQILRLDRQLSADERLTNIVVMGIGEPLQNLPVLLSVLDEICSADGYGLSPRRITISTVGLPAKILELARHGRPYNLAVSLHAPTEELRNRLVPVNERIGIEAILAAADEYFSVSGRRVTYEYVLLGGLNDDVSHAQDLGRLLSSRNAHVNLIPMNRVDTLPFEEPDPDRTRRFVEALAGFGVVATVRKRKGADIDAACGQLRLKAEPVSLEVE